MSLRTLVLRRLPKNLLSLILVIFTLIVFQTYWYTGTSNINKLFERPASPKLPDTYLSSTISWQFDKQGKLEYKLTSAEATHLPHNDTVIMHKPDLTTFTDGAPAWRIQADHGTSSSESEVIRLYDSVNIRNADATMNMQTQSVLFTPETKYAETNQPVTVTSDTGKTTAVGMNAWLESKRIQFLSQVRSQYESN